MFSAASHIMRYLLSSDFSGSFSYPGYNRYVLDGGSKLQTCWKRDGSLENAEQEVENSFFSLIPSIFKDFILPAGYPGKYGITFLP